MELNEKGKISRTWFKYLYDLIEKFNITVTRSTNLKPEEAIKMEKVKQNF